MFLSSDKLLFDWMRHVIPRNIVSALSGNYYYVNERSYRVSSLKLSGKESRKLLFVWCIAVWLVVVEKKR